MARQNQTIEVKGSKIQLINKNKQDYISLTDMVKSFGDETIIYNWMRNRNTIEFLGIWEQINNPDFKPLEFDRFRRESGLNRFTMSPKKWTQATNAIGVFAKSGRYGGGTYAHKDIAFEFGSWLSPEFKLYLITEFQKLKEEENKTRHLQWDLQRTLAKINYRIHTDAIKENLIPPKVSKDKINIIYANEADLLNVALFGKTAKEWREQNPNKSGNIRDHAALEQLVVLTNLESINAMLIDKGSGQTERLNILNTIAITQMKSLVGNKHIKKLK
ncbi:MAG: KilA-N domain-containing protein [Candidatus Aenigmarchaeota archaeon]|nr:KilA-N domain-containing protein [Candidatus Aenigmarchaeota archaeon]